MSTSKRLWSNVYAAAIRRGANDHEIAEAMSVSERTLRTRKNDPGTATLKEIDRLCRWLGITIRELARED